MRLLLKTAVLALLTPTAGGAEVLYVDDDAVAGGDGMSWRTAYRFLQGALLTARDPANGISEIRVAAGLYRPDRDDANPQGTGVRSVAFELVDGIVIVGGYQGLSGPSPDDRDVAAYRRRSAATCSATMDRDLRTATRTAITSSPPSASLPHSTASRFVEAWPTGRDRTARAAVYVSRAAA